MNRSVNSIDLNRSCPGRPGFGMSCLCLLVLSIFQCLSAQGTVGEWRSITSMLTPEDIIFIEEGQLLAATEGGLLTLNLGSGDFEFLREESGLESLDVSCVARDASGRLWLGGNAPEGMIQIFQPEDLSVVSITHLDVSKIHKIVLDESAAFAVFHDDSGWGILEFQIPADGEPYYQDRFVHFPIPAQEITDVDITPDSVFVTCPDAVFTGSRTDYLSQAASWQINENPSDGILLGLSTEPVVTLMASDGLFTREESGWNPLVNISFSDMADFLYDPEVQGYFVLTSHQFFLIDAAEGTFSETPIPVNAYFTALAYQNNTVAMGVAQHGFLLEDLLTDSMEFYIPNSALFNRIHAVTVLDDGTVVSFRNDPHSVLGLEDRRTGICLMQDDHFYAIVPDSSAVDYPIFIAPHNQFAGGTISYHPGEKPPRSIVKTDHGTLMFSNSGLQPREPGFRGGLVEVNPETLEYAVYDTTDGILDGLNGVYNPDWTNRYITMHQLNTDYQGNTWAVTPYSEVSNKIAVIQWADGSGWTSVDAPDEESYLPQEVAFDLYGRAWFGLQLEMDINSTSLYSSGLVKVFDYHNSLENTENNQWRNVSVSEPPGYNIWSLTFDRQGMLWILTDGGVQGYFVLSVSGGFQLSPIYPSHFLTYLPFREGDKIRVDGQNNKWIITQHSGLRVIQENTNFWPDESGFTQENSGLLSNIVYDVAFDEAEGLAYFATDKGLSVMRLPVSNLNNDSAPDNLQLSPNPFIPQRDSQVIINNAIPGGIVKIVGMNGKVYWESPAVNAGLGTSQILWDGRCSSGDWIGSGIYFVTCYHTSGSRSAKLAVIRQ